MVAQGGRNDSKSQNYDSFYHNKRFGTLYKAQGGLCGLTASNSKGWPHCVVGIGSTPNFYLQKNWNNSLTH